MSAWGMSRICSQANCKWYDGHGQIPSIRTNHVVLEGNHGFPVV